MHHRHPFMPLLGPDPRPPRGLPVAMESPRRCTAHVATPSRSARADRARASLRNSHALPAVLASNHTLAKALQPFVAPRAATARDAVCFLYAFGVAGPTVDDWHALFFASLSSHLRVEQLVVLAASAACGVSHFSQALPDTVSTVIFGADGLPPALHKVCDLYDDWLLSEHFFERVLELHISSVADRWSIHVHRHGCTVRVNDKQWHVSNQLSPTAVTEVCAKILVASVAPKVIQQVSLMISYGGHDRVHEMLQRSLVQFLYAGVVHAKSILYERILRAFGH